MKRKKILIIIPIILLTVAFSYTAYSAFFSQPTRAKGLVGHWSLSDEDEIGGTELHTQSNASSVSNEASATTGWSQVSSTLTSSASSPYVGSYSLKAVSTVINGRMEYDFTAVVGTTYKISIFAKRGSQGTHQAFAAWVGLSTGDTVQTNITSTSWTEYVFYQVATDTSAKIRIYANRSVADVGDEVYVDKVTIQPLSVADSTINENNGTVYGATYTTDRNGQSNKAMDFDGTDDYISIADQDYFSFGDSTSDEPFSVSAWIKMDDATNFPIVSKTQNTSSPAIEWIFGTGGSNNLHFSLYDNTSSNAIRTYSAFLLTSYEGQWIHVVGTYDGSGSETGLELYIDGALRSQTKSEGGTYIAMHNTTIPVEIGVTYRSNATWDSYADGSISSVRIHDRALTQTEITELYESYNPVIKVGAKRKGLVGEWSLGDTDEVMGAELLDNGTFDDTSNWVVAGGGAITVTGGEAELSSGSWIIQTQTTTIGKRYRAHVNARETGSAGINYSGISDVWGSDPIVYLGEVLSGTTSYDFDFTASDTRSRIAIKERLGIGGTLFADNVSLKEIHAADLTPNSNNGTVYGATYTTDRNSQSNKAMSFNGTSDYINIDGVVADVANDTAGTWMAWVKPTTATLDGRIITFGDTNANERLLFIISATTEYLTALAVDSGTTQWVLATDASPFSDGIWTHVALVQNGTSPVFYVDGIAVAQTISTPTDTTAWMSDLTGLDNARIGDSKWNNGAEADFFDGSISNVKIYNRALSASEILDIYDDYNPVAKIGSLKKGLVGHWTMDDADGQSTTVIGDRSPKDNAGTMTSMTFAGNETTDRHGQTRALAFGGAADYINIDAVVADVASDTAGTWSLWIKPDVGEPASTGTPMAYGDTDANTKLQIFHYGPTDKLYAVATITGVTQWQINADVNPFSSGVWAHIVLVQDGVSPVFYVNGEAVDITLKSDPVDTTAWISSITGIDNARIGCTNYTNGGNDTFYDGSIQDARIYNRALTAAEVKMLYEQY